MRRRLNSGGSPAPETRIDFFCVLLCVPSASKPKYTFDFSEEEEDEGEEEENGEDDVATSPVRSPKEDFPASETKGHYHDDEDEDEDNGISFSPLKQKPT